MSRKKAPDIQLTREEGVLLRQWVQAEIDYALAAREDGEDGYRCSAVAERKEAERAFAELLGGNK